MKYYKLTHITGDAISREIDSHKGIVIFRDVSYNDNDTIEGETHIAGSFIIEDKNNSLFKAVPL